MSFDRCKNCGKYDFLETHKCKPEWEAIYDEDYDGRSFGYDAESAALDYAEKHFASWDYPEEMQIKVRKIGDDDWIKFEVTVEPVPSFSASQIEQDQDKK